MLRIALTHEIVFSFGGPNLCLLGNPNDFRLLAEAIADLTIPDESHELDLSSLQFGVIELVSSKTVFASKPNAVLLGKMLDHDSVLFELDPRYWERIFKFFVFMSCGQRTYYLNNVEDALNDLDLDQDCNFICSSEF